MKKSVALRLSKSLKMGLGESKTFLHVESRPAGELSKFHISADGKPCFGSYLVQNGQNQKLWILIIDWKNDGNYYVSVYPEKSQIGVLADLHKKVENGQQSELQWTYTPRKQDKKNDLRKEAFQRLVGQQSLTVSLPGADVTVDEFLNDIFALVEVRLSADAFNGDPKSLESTVFTEGRRVWKKHRLFERNSKAVILAKSLHKKKHHGKSPCELCGFDYGQIYATIGEGYIEAHHKVPLYDLIEDEVRNTRAEDFLLLCANCHRMVHRTSFGGCVEEVRKVLATEL